MASETETRSHICVDWGGIDDSRARRVACQHGKIVSAGGGVGLEERVSRTPGSARLPGSRRGTGSCAVAAILVERNPEILSRDRGGSLRVD